MDIFHLHMHGRMAIFAICIYRVFYRYSCKYIHVNVCVNVTWPGKYVTRGARGQNSARARWLGQQVLGQCARPEVLGQMLCEMLGQMLGLMLCKMLG